MMHGCCTALPPFVKSDLYFLADHVRPIPQLIVASIFTEKNNPMIGDDITALEKLVSELVRQAVCMVWISPVGREIVP